jgi:heme A synthase
LVVVQVGLGVASVLSLLNLAVITTHLAVGAALLGSFVLLWCVCPADSRSREKPRTAHATDTVAAT